MEPEPEERPRKAQKTSPTSASHFRLLDLPREIIRLICLHVYDPLECTQQDRLTWGIFSTVDMDEARQHQLHSLIRFGWVSRKVRREARVVLFRCIRVSDVKDMQVVVDQRESWGKYVKSIIIDLNMFDADPEPDSHGASPSLGSTPQGHKIQAILPRRPRSCWSESAQLVELVRCLPHVAHLCIFADASDDSALALFFSSLITHPSLHMPPPPTRPSTPKLAASVRTRSSTAMSMRPADLGSPEPDQPPLPITSRLRSFGWRQRAAPPSGFRQYAQVSTFVSTLHLIRHSYRLSTLVLDADMDEMDPEDILTVCRELRQRPPPAGEMTEKVSLTLCGPIRGWDAGVGDGRSAFLEKVAKEYDGFRELFIDRPLRKSHMAHETTVKHFITLVQPLAALTHLRLLQIGSYTWTPSAQIQIVETLASMLPSLLVVGLLNQEAQTSWWGLWRRIRPPKQAVAGQQGAGSYQLQEAQTGTGTDVWIEPLGDGHLRTLEDEADAWQARISAMREHRRIEDVEMDAENEMVLPPSASTEADWSHMEGASRKSGSEEIGRISLKRILSS